MRADYVGAPQLQTKHPIILTPFKIDGSPLTFLRYRDYAARQLVQSVHRFAEKGDGFEQITDLCANSRETILMGPHSQRRVVLKTVDKKAHIVLGCEPTYLHGALAFYFADLLGADGLSFDGSICRADRRSVDALNDFLFEASRFYHSIRGEMFGVDCSEGRSPVLYFHKTKLYLPADASSRVGDWFIPLVAQKLGANGGPQQMRQKPELRQVLNGLFSGIRHDMCALLGFRPD